MAVAGVGGEGPAQAHGRCGEASSTVRIIVFGPGVDVDVDVDVDVNIGLQAPMSFLTQGVSVMHDGNQMVAVLGIR